MKTEIIIGVVTAVVTAGILAASEASFGWISSALNRNPLPLPSGVIVMTDLECAKLGDDWTVFADAGGRFPIAIGTTTDERGETRNFSPTQKPGGAYMHLLTPSEMPNHSHTYTTETVFGDKRRPEISGRSGLTFFGQKSAQTSSVGSNKPHNNMPPYIPLNFCQLQ